MPFKENLLKKIDIDRLADKVIHSMGPPESGRRIDKDAMRSLLEISPYTYRRERDLDLYVRKWEAGRDQILVLDNELPIYRTTVADVAMRKSPFIKEMANIFKIIKILKDADVKVSRKEESVQTIRAECVAQLDLTFSEADIEALAQEGRGALERDYADGVIEILELFAELLGYKAPPKALQLSRHKILARLTPAAADEILSGPLVVYNLFQGTLRLIKEQISNYNKAQIEYFMQIAAGEEKAALEGADVFEYLKQEVLKNPGPLKQG